MNFKIIGSFFIIVSLVSCSLPKTDLTPDQAPLEIRQTVRLLEEIMETLTSGSVYNTGLYRILISVGKKQIHLLHGMGLKRRLILDQVAFSEVL